VSKRRKRAASGSSAGGSVTDTGQRSPPRNVHPRHSGGRCGRH
jgi:hypothetical protein